MRRLGRPTTRPTAPAMRPPPARLTGTGAFMAVGAYATYNLLLRLPELP